ncbi:MAG TPA: hypothetical protein VGK67_23875 [Myxococcales bacterium]|jgi:hypothetical protein
MGADENHWQKQLETGLKRVQDALAKDERPHAQLLQVVVAAASAKALEKINEGVERQEERKRRREEKREERRRRRDRDAKAGVPVGMVFAVFSLIAIYFGLTRPELWWMFFVSLGFAIPAAGIFGAALTAPKALPAGAEKAAAGQALTSPIDARVARVEAICQKVLAAIQSGPPVVREVVHKPEETLKSLTSTCKELAHRERELRAAVTEEDDRRLRTEHDGLISRVAAENDPVSRQRLESALRALEGQLAQRAELVTAASRLEAEQTRILYTLENLHTQVLRARSADAASADVAGAGLRKGLEQLGEEISAVASALEETHGAHLMSPVVDVTGGSAGSSSDRDRLKS